MMLVVNDEQSESHLDKNDLISTNTIAQKTDVWGKKAPLRIVIERIKKALLNLFDSCFRFCKNQE